MTALNRSTRHRLQKLRQVPSVWEGDRRMLTPTLTASLEADTDVRGDCVLWVDGTEGLVRAMDLVAPEMGHEAVVRTLLRAMENPHSSARPARPQKIVVRDRELQFFLRGVLQELDIVIDYEPELPLIDEIFHEFQEVANNRPPQIPAELMEDILKVAYEIWQDAPWEVLDEEKIVAVELNYGDVETLYVSILGMLGMEYGLLMYRSLDSLKQFRHRVLMAEDSPKQLEGAFLAQDCLFITYDQSSELAEEPFGAGSSEVQAAIASYFAETGVQPSFGNLHPLEGMRPVLYDDEAIAVLVALQAMHRFFQQHLPQLEQDAFPVLSNRYRIANPTDAKKKISVKVSTMPELAEELFEMSAEVALQEGALDLETAPILRDDLVPGDSFYSLGAMPWEVLELLRAGVKVHQAAEAEFPAEADGFPVILIQTSRPKAMALIEGLQAAGGLEAICFNPGSDPFANQHYDLGVLQTKNGELHLFGEFVEDDPVHIQARQKWDQRCKKTKGYCGLVIARGLKGASRGNPGFNDMLALFEARSLSPGDLGLGPLELVPQFE
ncbi:hypothetical protein IQ268_18495 [Oculatella sp. LEGE 06141]|uniref:DUF6930 domain-containing protein n=1 Tax=Oculatella sp. LEGE 06141 TaxID=1828648 RepID=UPI00187FAFC8|nr:hypothetical protein [Oculatella sp. LEGE 06141]MBE9180554.1 hypothetical protein [Oculatella sp. LEGE 06141]